MAATTRIFCVSSLAGAMTLAAALDAGLFAPDGRRLLLVAHRAEVPETTPAPDALPGFARLRGRFDEVLSWNAVIAPFHPAAWSPRPDDVPLWERYLRGLWRLGDDEVRLVVESVQESPSLALCQVFTGAPVDVLADGLAVYGPTGEKIDPLVGTRVGRLLHTGAAPGLTPLLLAEYGVPSVPVPAEALTKVAGELAEDQAPLPAPDGAPVTRADGGPGGTAAGNTGTTTATPDHQSPGQTADTPAHGSPGRAADTPDHDNPGQTADTGNTADTADTADTPHHGNAGQTADTPPRGNPGTTADTPARQNTGPSADTPARAPAGGTRALLLAEGLAARGLLSPAGERELLRRTVRDAVALGHRHLVLRPPPGAPARWSHPLEEEAARLGAHCSVLAPGLPAEAALVLARPALVVGCLSAALLTAPERYGVPAARMATGPLPARLTPYAHPDRPALTLVDALVPELGAPPGAAPPREEVAALLDAVAFAMRPAVRPDLRAAAEAYLSRHLDARTRRYFPRRRLAALALPGAVPARLEFLPRSPAVRRLARRARSLTRR
ncbi:polysialyltransferase family glycosyltransferase [Streptomyces tagetis]|uniref:Uncharacterized protein n=1 Tax=Streptomyces tagetis TaxID=2820809 RepID=A0A940XLC2_9ACTN|nr:polysialyltransferase family glycosyltransferase [Streptomyces sp. RG38]MBQ0828531.1 hypothetical protein [Streptomyces sp. RG38]